jgi:hypothetical protein
LLLPLSLPGALSASNGPLPSAATTALITVMVAWAGAAHAHKPASAHMAGFSLGLLRLALPWLDSSLPPEIERAPAPEEFKELFITKPPPTYVINIDKV